MISFFRFVMVMTSFDSLLDQCTCFRTRQTAHLSRSSPGVGFHPNLHPNQGFIRVHDIYYCCVNRFYNRTKLYRIAHYLQPSPTSSPVSRTKIRTNIRPDFLFVRPMWRTFVNLCFQYRSDLFAQMDDFSPEKTHSWHDSWQGKRYNRLKNHVIKI